MSRRLLVLAAAAAAVVPAAILGSAPASAIAAAPSGPAPAATPAVVPPDLQALDAKMLALKPNSERFSTSLSISTKPVVKGPIGGFGHIFGRTSNVSAPLLTASGEVSLVPQEASVEVSFLGLHSRTRLIGTTVYVQEPFIKRLDGGRPWVEKRNQTLPGVLSEAPAAPGGLGGLQTGFGGLVKLVNSASSIKEIGAATIDGQATSAFKISIELTRVKKLSTGQKRIFRKTFLPLATIELFIAEDGLPVRSRAIVRARHGKGELIAQSDVLAINIPVAVQPPPADQTISQGNLNRLLARIRARRRRARAHAHQRGQTK